jgi:hypothetical protein
MTDLWVIGITHVDRSKREFRVWVMRVYPGLTLLRSYSFFCGLLHDLFTVIGGNERYSYELSGMLPGESGPPPEGLKHLPDAHKDPRKFVEHVEMIRWCGPPENPNPNNDDKEAYEQATRHLLQAEYLVRVTDTKYMTRRMDPCFIGNFYMNTAGNDSRKDGTMIELGPRQMELIHPLESFFVTDIQSQQHIQYAAQHLNTIEDLLEAMPKILQEDPTIFTPQVFPLLQPDEQRRILSILAFAKRPDSVLSPLVDGDNNLLFSIFSFLPLHDARRYSTLRQIYLSLECVDTIWPPDIVRPYYNALHEVAMKHCSMKLLIRRLCKLAEDTDNTIVAVFDDGDETQAQLEDRASAYAEQLRTMLTAVQGLPFPLSQLFPTFAPTGWIRRRLQAADQAATMQFFLENIIRVPPDDIRHGDD